MPAGLGLDFAGALFSGGDIGDALINNISGGDPSNIFGKKPEVAPFVPVDLSAETGKAVSANLANYPAISELLNKIIPGFTDIISQGTENTLAELQGQLPPDVSAQVQRSSAFRSLLGGFGGTAMGHALSARDLGTTSLGLTQIGTNAAQQWANIAEQAYGPFTISTGQQAGTTAANNAGKQATDQFKFNVEAGPDPATAGLFALDQHIGDQFMSFGLGAAGGAISGVGGIGGAAGAGSVQGVPGYSYNPSTGQYVSTGPPAYDWRSNATWSGIGGGG